MIKEAERCKAGVKSQIQRAMSQEKIQLSAIERRGEGRESTIVLKLNGATSPKIERIEGPARLIIDLPNVERGLKTKLVAIDSPYVSRARLGDHPTFTRVVFLTCAMWWRRIR